ncbi:MAG: hypothetical protein K1X83_05265 [Oligoflexia bacterium]|nr:hypothetical protein [Oligoflexia bacterium]
MSGPAIFSPERCSFLLAPAERREAVGWLLFSLISTPFLIMTAIFIPVLGQLLALLCSIATIYFLRARRSWLVALAIVGGAAAFALILWGGMPVIRPRVDLFLFVLMVLGIPYCLFFSAVMGAAAYFISTVK